MNETKTETTTVEVAEDRHGELVAHKAGCAHLRRMGVRGWTFEAATRDDVVYEMWGASGPATDDYPGDLTGWPNNPTPEFRAYTIREYTSCTPMAPCLKHLRWAK